MFTKLSNRLTIVSLAIMISSALAADSYGQGGILSRLGCGSKPACETCDQGCDAGCESCGDVGCDCDNAAGMCDGSCGGGCRACRLRGHGCLGGGCRSEQCDECILKSKEVDIKKKRFTIEHKKICVPKVRMPWDSCCEPQYGPAKCVRVLKVEKYKVRGCKHSWLTFDDYNKALEKEAKEAEKKAKKAEAPAAPKPAEGNSASYRVPPIVRPASSGIQQNAITPLYFSESDSR